MTNGEKIKEIFPDGVLTSGGNNSYYWGDDILVSKNWWNAEYKEPVIRDNGVKDELNRVKNELAVDCISRADARKAIIDHQYSDSFCEEHSIDHSINTSMALIALSDLPSVTPQLSSELEKNSKKLEKDFGESDCISREATVKRLCNLAEYMNEHKENSGAPYIMAVLFI